MCQGFVYSFVKILILQIRKLRLRGSEATQEIVVHDLILSLPDPQASAPSRPQGSRDSNHISTSKSTTPIASPEKDLSCMPTSLRLISLLAGRPPGRLPLSQITPLHLHPLQAGEGGGGWQG